MKKTILLIVLSFCLLSISQAQTVLFQAVPNSTTKTNFTTTKAANVSVSSVSFTGFTSTTNPCSYAPSRTFIEPKTIYDNYMADSGKTVSFTIYPSSSKYQLSISDLKFKISSNVANLKYRVHLNIKLTKRFTPYNDTAFTPTLVSGCDANLANNTTETVFNYPTKLVGTNIIDSINKLQVVLVFYNAPTSADIRISSIKADGCVLAATATTTCTGSQVTTGLATGASAPYNKFNLVYSDEFDSTAYDVNNWQPRTVGGFGGTMTENNIIESGGQLHLIYTWDTLPSATVVNKKDTFFYGGGICNAHNTKYGYYEVKGKIFQGQDGLHQSIWQVGSAPTPAMKSLENNPYTNSFQNQLYETDSWSKTLQPSIWGLKGNGDSEFTFRNQGGSDAGLRYESHITDINIAQYFTSGLEVMPDSVKYYFNGKLRLAYPMVYPYDRDAMAMSMQISALPTPINYYVQNNQISVPLPPAGAEMTVDYYRFYAPKSCIGINFLSNFTFGDPWWMTTSTINKPNGWINPTSHDLLGNYRLNYFNPAAANQDSLVYVPDLPNNLGVPRNTWSMLHKLNSAAYRTATRQVLEYIPNGIYAFNAYVKSSNIIGDTVLLRVKTRTAGNLADTIYQVSANAGTNTADLSWRKVTLNNVPVINNFATVEFYSSAAAGSYTYFDSATFIGVSDTLLTVSKQGCIGGSMLLVSPADIPASTIYQWQVSTFSNGSYNAWNNLATGATAANSTNGFGASYTDVTNDSIVVSNINSGLLKARYRCLMTTAATATNAAYTRYSDTYQFDAINAALSISVTPNSPIYLGAALIMSAFASGGSGTYSNYLWSGPANFSDTLANTFKAKLTSANNGTYSVVVTDNKGCYKSANLSITAIATPSNPVTVIATAPNVMTAFSTIQLSAAASSGSGNFSYSWIGPNGYSASGAIATIANITTALSGVYTVLVTDNSNGFVASDTELVTITKRPQTISFNNISNISSYTSSTKGLLKATASSGLPVRFGSSNTSLLRLVTDTSFLLQQTNPDYAITLLTPVSTNKIRLYTTQTSHFHIEELRVYAPNNNGYPTNVLEDLNDTLDNGQINLASTLATTSASGQYALGAAYMPDNVIDGQTASDWVSADGSPQWVELDFPSPVTVGHVQFINGYQNGNGTWAGLMDLSKLSVQYWDGSNWQNVADCKVNVTAYQDGDDNNLPASYTQQVCVNTTAKSVNRIIFPPTISSPSITNITIATALLGANVTDTSGVSLTAKGIYYDTIPSPSANSTNSPNNYGGVFTQTISGLLGNTLYYFRGFATNVSGTTYTPDSSFLTLPNVPTVNAATNVSTIGFCANWSMSQAGNRTYSCSLQLSNTSDFSANVISYNNLNSSVTSHCFSGLMSNTTYYIRINATNASGTTAWSSTQSIQTLSLPVAPLDGVAAPITALSLRMLRSSYSGPVIRIRRDLDSSFADVYFDANQRVSLASPISFTGSTPLDSSLGGWIGNNNGFVAKWYDQSGNGNHAYKSTALILRTGTVSFTTGSTTLTGSGTSFSTSNSPVGSLLLTGTGRLIGVVSVINSTTSITLVAAPSFAQSGVTYGMLRQPRIVNAGVVDTLDNGLPTVRFFEGANGGTNLQHPNFTNDGGLLNMKNVQYANIFTVIRQDNTFNFAGLFNTTAVNTGTGAPANQFQFQLLTNSTTHNSFFNGVSGGNSNNNIRATAFTMNGVMNARFKMTTSGGITSAQIPIPTAVNPTTATNFLSVGNFGTDSIQLFGHNSSSTNMFEGVCPEMVFYGSTTSNSLTEAQATAFFNNQSRVYGVLSITNPNVSSVTTNSAIIGSTIYRSASATIISRGSVYDTLSSPRSNVVAITGDYNGAFTQARTNLLPNTHYYFRGFMTTSATDTTFTADSNFTTLSNAPTSKSPNNVGTNTATALWGKPIGIQGNDSYTYNVQYGTNSSFTSSDTISVQGLTDSSLNIAGLLPNTVYYYRVLIKNSGGYSAWSATQSFTTLMAFPTINTLTINSVSATSATAGATVTSNGGGTLLARGTLYGTTALPITNQLAEGGVSTGAFTMNRTGLTGNTNYYFRAYAINTAGTSYTNDTLILTPPDVVNTTSSSNVTSVGFTVNWALMGNNSVYTSTVQISTVADFTTLLYNYSGNASSVVQRSINGLSANTIYYYRVQMVNASGTGAWSTVKSVTTLPIPTTTIDNSGSTNPTLAYSVRLLRSTYVGPAMRVRRDNDNAVVDVYFDGNQRVSLQSPVSANGGGAVTDNTFSNWIGTNTAYVTVWYDQSGNSGRNLPAATVSSTRTGTITVASGSTAITGASTLFSTETVAGSILMNASGQTIGQVASIQSNTALTLVAGANIALSGSAYYLGRQPRIVNAGSLDTLANGVATLKMTSGSLGGILTNFNVPNFTNDASGTNLQSLTNLNIFVTQRQLSNTGNAVALFNTAAPTSGSPTSKLQFLLAPSSVSSFYKSISSATSPSATPSAPALFGNTILMSGRLKVAVSGSTATAQIASSLQFLSAGVSGFLGTNNAASFDNTQIKVFDYLGFTPNCFDGFAPELVFYGTGGSAMSETDATNLLIDQSNYFGVLSVKKPTVSAITATSATLGATVSTNSSATITARGTVYGTTTKPTANALAEGATTIGTYTHSRTGLTANTLYYYRGYITNSVGTFYSEDSVFTTLPNAPLIAAANNNSTTGFTANWSAPSGGNAVLTYTLQYSTASDFSSGNTTVSSISGTNYVITGLTANTNYYYRVQSVNASGSSGWSSTQITATLSNAPVSAAASSISSTAFTANWTAPASLGSVSITYSLIYGTTSDLSSGNTTVTTISSLSNVVSGLVANTNYYYQVVAVNAGGTSAASTIQSVITSSASPSIAAATGITTTGYTANWSAPGGGNAALTYTLQYSTASDFSSGNTTVSSISGTNYVITGLTANTNYYYRVQSVNASGSSGWSSTQITATLSNAPVSAAASSISSTAFTANWTAPASQGSVSITYSLIYGTTPDLTSGNTTVSSISSLSNVVSGLVANTNYYYQVVAVNAGGTSAASTIQPVITSPASPSIAAATGISTTGFTANWSEPSGGNAALTYTLQYSTAADFSTGNTTVSGISATGNSITGLTANTNYYYRVAAVSSGGTSDWSTSQTVLLLPNTPTNLLASGNSTSGITIGWSAPTNQGASTFTYTLQYSTTSDFSSGNTSVTNIASLSSIITGLTANTNYYVRMAAVNASGSSSYSSILTTSSLSLPPTISSASSISTVGFTANWLAPASQGSVNYTYTYTLQYSTSASFTNNVTTVSVISSSLLSSVISGLSSNTTYFYRVQAVNQGGNSAWSSVQSVNTSQSITGILENLSSTPVLAYSVRQLRTTYTGPALRIRKDNTTNDSVDVYFDAKQRVSLSSPVSAVLTGAAIGAATATSLGTFIGTNSGFVTIWYDQSGNGKNAFSNALLTTKTSSTISTTSGSKTATVSGFANTTFTSNGSATSNSTTVTTTSSSNSTIHNGYSIVGNGIPANTIVTGFSGNPIVITLSNSASIPAGTTLSVSNLCPGNVLSNITGQVIGTIDSIYSNNTSTIALKTPATATLSATAYGFVSQPRLINAGVLDTLANGMPSLRVMNGIFSGSPLAITNFTNDGGGTNLQGMKYLNVFVTAQQTGNLYNDNGVFNSGAVGTGTANRLQLNLSRSGANSIYKSLSTGNSTAQGASFTQGLLAAARLRTFVSSTTDSAYFYTSFSINSGVKDFLGASNATVLDATQPQIFGFTGFVHTFYDGYCPELIFYGSTSTAINEADATAIITDQTNVYGILSVKKPTVTSITATSATLGATVSTNSNATITARGTVYGITSKPTTNALTEGATTMGTYTHSRTGLVPNTTYYYRGYVTNGLGTFYSEDSIFTTFPATPTIASPTNILTNGFTANWTAALGGNASFSYLLQYSTTSDFSASVVTIATISSSVTSYDLNGLTPNTVYYYRVAALNGMGTSSWSSAQSVTTISNSPVFTSSTNICTDIATVNWTAPTTQGGASYTYSLQYSPTVNFSSSVTTISGINAAALSQAISNLTANTTYYYRIAAINSGGASAYSLTNLATTANYNWTGTSSTLWNDASNWCANTLPTAATNVEIPAGLNNYPLLAGTGSVNNLLIDNNAALTVTGTLQVSGSMTNNGTLNSTTGTIVLNGGTPQTIAATTFSNNTIKSLTINNTAGVAIGGALNLTGTLTPLAGTLSTGGFLTLKSDSIGTARIAQGTGNYITGNVTVERFVPAKNARRYSFVGSAVSDAIIQNTWQKNIYITGNGNGGQVCGTTSSNGGQTDKYNGNGFDKTPSNSPSMFTYNAIPVNGSRWSSVSNTNNTNLIPGKGYLINIRGDRNSNSLSCDNQLNTSSPDPPGAVTISACGKVSFGDMIVPINDSASHKFTLIANPYPSPINFTNFWVDNSAAIPYKMWSFSPVYGNGNYSTFANGIITNAAGTEYNSIGDFIASGQAFFVESKTGASSVTFKESHKVATAMPNTKYFGASTNKMIRVGLKSVNNRALDEVVIAFNTSGSISYNSAIDATSFNSGSQVLVVLKDSARLAIATFPDTLLTHSIKLGVATTSSGTFRFAFSNYEGMDTIATSMVFKDNFLNVNYDVLLNPTYDFNVTSDTASKGTNRFELLFAKQTTLPVAIKNITAKKQDRSVAIQWEVANSTNIGSYIVQRSTDGTHFKDIDFVSAVPTKSFYNITDSLNELQVGALYYRIKATIKEGNFLYSSVASIDPQDISIINYEIYPNPVDKLLSINFLNNKSNQYQAKVLTITGQSVLNKSLIIEEGNSMATIDVSGVSKGIYILSLSDKDGNSINRKFIKK